MARIRQRPLSIFLLKEEVATLREAVRDTEVVDWYDVTARGVSGLAAVKHQSRKAPWWATYLAPHLASGDALASLANASTAAVLLIEAADRHFAFAFGYGRHLLNANAYELDFGLKVVLNTVAPDRLMSVDSRTFDDLTMHTRRDLSQGSSFGTFGLDVSRDLVRAVTGPPRKEIFGRRATGADSLTLMTRAQLEDLPELCTHLLAAYEADDYKERFPWLDHLRRVREPDLVERLNLRLVQVLRDRELTDVHLAPPEPIPWQHLEGFTFSGRDSDELDTDPRISAYLDGIDLDGLELADLREDRVIAVSAESGQPLEQWPVLRCIVFEVRDGSALYALSAGQWYQVDASFAEEVERFADALPELHLELPDGAGGVREDEYNAEAAARVGALCLDKKLVATPTGDRIELCDLLTPARQLVHIKKRGSSSTLSHLFAQGVVSAELLGREPAFRAAARDVVTALDESFAGLIPNERPLRDTWEVAFVVLTRSRRASRLTLPFFSLVNLRTAAQRLQELGYRVSVKRVNEV